LCSERMPPYDIDAEEAVIGSLLIDGSAIFKIATLLQQQDFYHEQNRLLYEACLSLYQRNEAINQITVAQELDRKGRLEECGGAAYLSHLISMVPTSLDIEYYAQIVYRLAVSRRLITAARQIEAVGYEANPDVDASLNKAEDILFRLRHGQSPRDLIHVRQVLDSYFETPPSHDVEGYVEQIPYVLSNFVGLDDFLGGFQRSDLTIIAGRPSMGKTSFALSVAGNAAVKQGACVAIFSMEMAREPLVLRLLASEADVDSRRIRLGRHTTEDEEKRIMDAIGILSDCTTSVASTSLLSITCN
jgi:replicative DNA helicase